MDLEPIRNRKSNLFQVDSTLDCYWYQKVIVRVADSGQGLFRCPRRECALEPEVTRSLGPWNLAHRYAVSQRTAL